MNIDKVQDILKKKQFFFKMTYNSFVCSLVVCVAATPSILSERNTQSKDMEKLNIVLMDDVGEKSVNLYDINNENSTEDFANRSRRIVGGYAANIKDFPFVVSLHFLNKTRTRCGGSIVHRRYVLTAKHCIRNNLEFIRAGSSNRTVGGTTHQIRSKFLNSEGDIGIIEVDEPFVWNENTSKIGLFNHDEPIISNTNANVLGWGLTVENYSLTASDILRTVEVPIIRRQKCQIAYSKQPYKDINQSFVCAGNGTKDACDGDSGGPLVINGRLVGIVSDGYGCAREGYPGIYQSIPYFREWIRSSIHV